MTELPELTPRDRAILELEMADIAHGAKEAEIRRRFEFSPARYYQVLNRLLDHPAAIAEWPVEVGRMRRLRDRRMAARSRREFAS